MCIYIYFFKSVIYIYTQSFPKYMKNIRTCPSERSFFASLWTHVGSARWRVFVGSKRSFFFPIHQMCFACAIFEEWLPPSESGKWKFMGIPVSPTKKVMILAVTVTGRGSYPSNSILAWLGLKVCRDSLLIFRMVKIEGRFKCFQLVWLCWMGVLNCCHSCLLPRLKIWRQRPNKCFSESTLDLSLPRIES